MASSIDPTKPETGAATTESVRDNFSAAKTEIEALQAAGGTPGGSDKQIQYNDSGVFGGDAGLTYDGTTLDVIEASTGTAVHVDHNGNGTALRVDTSATSQTGVLISGLAKTTGSVLDISSSGAAASGQVALINQSNAGASADSLVVSQSGSGKAIEATGLVDVIGNITVSGTVDGRDVAADGALAASALQDKADVEAVLTGEISTHTHAGGGGGDTDHLAQYISGIEPSWTDDDTIGWSAGKATVNGTKLTYAGGNTGNLGQGDAGLSATGVWHHYLHSSGIELSQTAPAQDTHGRFWQKTGDATRRWVGWHWVYLDTTRKIGEFYAVAYGNMLTMEWPMETPVRIQSSDPGTTLTEKTNLNGVVPDCCKRVLINTKFSASAAGADLNAVASAADITSRAGKSSSTHSVRATFDNGGYTFFGPIWMTLKAANSLWIATTKPAGSMDAYLLDVNGGEVWR